MIVQQWEEKGLWICSYEQIPDDYGVGRTEALALKHLRSQESFVRHDGEIVYTQLRRYMLARFKGEVIKRYGIALSTSDALKELICPCEHRTVLFSHNTANHPFWAVTLKLSRDCQYTGQSASVQRAYELACECIKQSETFTFPGMILTFMFDGEYHLGRKGSASVGRGSTPLEAYCNWQKNQTADIFTQISDLVKGTYNCTLQQEWASFVIQYGEMQRKLSDEPDRNY